MKINYVVLLICGLMLSATANAQSNIQYWVPTGFGNGIVNSNTGGGVSIKQDATDAAAVPSHGNWALFSHGSASHTAGTASKVWGAYLLSLNSKSGTLTESIGVHINAGNESGATGTVTNAYGVLTKVQSGQGTVNNGYGVYINNIGAVNDYGLYQAGADDDNYFAGRIGLGTSAPQSNFHLSSTVGKSEFILEADADNNDENDNPFLSFKQDNGGSLAFIGLVGENNTAPQMPKYPRYFQNTDGTWSTHTDYPGSINNSLLLSTIDSKSIQIGTSGLVRMTVRENGNVGIGTNAPAGIFHLNGSAPEMYLTSTHASPLAAIRGNNSTFLFGYGGASGSEDISIGTQDGTGSRTVTIAAGGAPRMKIFSTGSVGIGTTTQDVNYLLSVNGKIKTKEVKVTQLQANWPDYVFYSGYKLRSLREVESFINSNNTCQAFHRLRTWKSRELTLAKWTHSYCRKWKSLPFTLLSKKKKLKDLRKRIRIYENWWRGNSVIFF